MRVHVLQHVPFEGLGSIGPWLAERGATVTTSRLFAGPEFPEIEDFDWLIILGGPMSVHDEQVYPWLGPEKEFVRKAIAQGKTVLGLCLGAQLMSVVLGGQVQRNPVKEIGWFPVRRATTDVTPSIAAALPGEFEAFHWHGETFDIPPGAVAIARSAGCAQQGFVLGDRVVGLQFHLETTPESAEALIRHCPEDLAPGPYVQGSAAILGDAVRFQRANHLMSGLLEQLGESHGGGPAV